MAVFKCRSLFWRRNINQSRQKLIQKLSKRTSNRLLAAATSSHREVMVFISKRAQHLPASPSILHVVPDKNALRTTANFFLPEKICYRSYGKPAGQIMSLRSAKCSNQARFCAASRRISERDLYLKAHNTDVLAAPSCHRPDDLLAELPALGWWRVTLSSLFGHGSPDRSYLRHQCVTHFKHWRQGVSGAASRPQAAA